MTAIQEISVTELKSMLDSKAKELIILDVRRADEYEYCNLGAKHIPMNEIPERISELPRDKTIVVHCHHGGRSRKVIQYLQEAHGFKNLVNLDGGIHAWACEIDSSTPTY